MSISLDSFDWDGNAAWQQYLCNVNYPGSDEAAQAYFLDKIKRKWYQRFVDDSFDPTPPTAPPSSARYESPASPPMPTPASSSSPSSSQSSPASQARASQPHPPPPPAGAPSTPPSPSGATAAVLQKMSMASNLGILCFGIQALVPLLVSSHAAVSYTFLCACVSYICSLIAIAGLPALSLTGLRTWGSQLVSGFRYNTPIADNLHFLIFSCIFLANPGFGFLSVIVVLIPALCALTSIAQARSWTLILPSFLKNHLDSLITKVNGSFQNMVAMVAMMQVLLFPYLFINLFFGSSSIMVVVAYFYFLSIRRRSSPLMQQLLHQLSTDIGAKCPAFVLPYFRRVEQALGALSHRIAP